MKIRSNLLRIIIAIAVIGIIVGTMLFPSYANATSQKNNPTSYTGTAWANPTRAYTSGTTYATITSGKPSDSDTWGNFGFNLAGDTIVAVSINYTAFASSSNNANICVSASWDGGTTWSAVQITPLSTSLTTYSYDVTGSPPNPLVGSFDYNWSSTMLNNGNLQVKIYTQTINSTSATVSMNNLSVFVVYMGGVNPLVTTDDYAVVGQATVTSGTGTVTGSPKRVTTAGATVTITTTGAGKTCTVTTCAGTTATATSGTATISGSPVSCAAGAVTTLTIANTITNGTFTLTVTYGSTGKWSNGYSWASSSGGTPNSIAVPTSTANAHFDANSFTAASQTFTNDATGTCASMVWTGTTNTPLFDFGTAGYLNVYGNVTFISAMTTAHGDDYGMVFQANGTLTTNALTLSCYVTTTAGLSLGSALTCGSLWVIFGGGSSSLTTNNYNVDVSADTPGFQFTQAGARTITLGSSVIKTSQWHLAAGATLTVNAGTSTIQLYNDIFADSSEFNGAGQTYNIVQFLGALNTFTGSATIGTVSMSATTTQTMTVTDGVTITAANMTLDGSAGHVHTLQGSSTGGWNITKTGGGTISMDYVSVSYSTASPDKTFYDFTHGTDGGHNTYWYFAVPAAPTAVAATDGTYPNKVTVTWTKSAGATGYRVYRGAVNDSGTLGDVATYDDTAGANPTITPGTATVTDGTSTSFITLTVSGQSASNGATESYTVYAYNPVGWSVASTADNGYKGTTTLTYQWWRSSSTSDGSYSSLGGATTNPYNDSTAPAPTVTAGTGSATDGTSTSYITLSISGQSANAGAVRWYYCVVSMPGTSDANTTHNDGYIGVGSLTYQWWRSSSTSDGSYSSLTGATTVPYNDSTAPAPTITAGTGAATDGTSSSYITLSVSGESTTVGAVRWYYCVVSATGATSANTTHNDGYIGVGSITYQWWRSSSTSDGSYSSLGGATTDPYNDTAAPAPTITAGTAAATDGTSTSYITLSVSGESAANGAVRWYYCVISATGATPANTTHNDGYIGTSALSYQWWRSSGITDASYSSLGGATTDPYNDSTAPAPTITSGATTASDGTSQSYVTLTNSGESTTVGAVRWYYCVISMGAATPANTTHNDGYIGVGSLTYQWQRSAADSNGSYSDIAGGTTDPYNDTGAPSDGSGRYFQCHLNAAGAAQATSTADRGYRQSLQITNAPTSKDFGVVMPTTTYYANGGAYSNPVTAGQCTFTITNNAVNNTVNIAISCTDATGGTTWTLVTGTPSGNQFKVIAVYQGENPASGLALTNSNQAFYPNLAALGTLKWDFEEILGGAGTGKSGTFSDSTQKTYTLTITAS